MEIPKKLRKEIKDYCVLNNITDVDTFILKCLKQGVYVEKYGTTPFKIGNIEPQIIEKEIIKEVEKIIEVPIEKIVEKEIIKEVEKIVEVPVTDDEYSKKLQNKIDVLSDKIKELENLLSKEKKNVEELLNSDEGVVRKLQQKIKNLTTQLEIEKNRHYKPPKKEKVKDEKPSKLGLRNVISWVSKSERKEDEDLYGE